ncbi:MAG TPA: hypothetical protein VH572_08495 [Gaiella sp.]
MSRVDRRRVQLALRVASLGFVVLWLLSLRLQELVPYQLPFAILLVTELELLVRAWRERRSDLAPPAPEELAARRRPGRDDADLGWGELVEDEAGGYVYLPPPARGRRRRRDRVLTALAAAAAVVLFVLAVRSDVERSWSSLSAGTRARAEALFTREAAAIAGRPVTVRCDEGYRYTGIGSDALGVAFPSRELAFLDPAVCRTLVALAFDGDRREREETGEAVLVLAHEAVHLRGERDEGVTECKALQEGGALGTRLGLPEERARRLMASLYARNLAERSITRLSYRLPAECRNGGSLDLRPADDRFP